MPRLSAVFAAAFLSTAAILAPSALDARGQHVSDVPQLTGVWALNEAMSQEVPLLPGEAASLARDAGLLPAASLRRKSNTGLDLHAVVRVRSAVREMLAASAKLSLAREGTRVVVTDGSGAATAVVPGGEPVRARQGDLQIELRARWQPPALVIERRFPDRTVLTERYMTFTDPRQLVITSTILNPGIDEPEATLMRVYDFVGGR